MASLTDLIAGGREVLVAEAGLDMRGVSDDFADGALDPAKWLVVSGQVTEVTGGLELRAAGETSAARTVPSAVELDAYADVEVRELILGAAAEAIVAGLGLIAGGSTFRLDIVVTRARKLARVTAGTYGAEVELGGSGAFAGQLHLLRVGGRVRAFVSGTEVADVGWTTAAAVVELRVSAPIGGAALTRITSYRRAAAALFGTEAALLTVFTAPGRAVVRVPPARVPGAVTLTFYGADGSTPIAVAGGFTYTLDSRNPVAGRSGSRMLTALGR